MDIHGYPSMDIHGIEFYDKLLRTAQLTSDNILRKKRIDSTLRSAMIQEYNILYKIQNNSLDRTVHRAIDKLRKATNVETVIATMRQVSIVSAVAHRVTLLSTMARIYSIILKQSCSSAYKVAAHTYQLCISSQIKANILSLALHCGDYTHTKVCITDTVDWLDTHDIGADIMDAEPYNKELATTLVEKCKKIWSDSTDLVKIVKDHANISICAMPVDRLTFGYIDACLYTAMVADASVASSYTMIQYIVATKAATFQNMELLKSAYESALDASIANICDEFGKPSLHSIIEESVLANYVMIAHEITGLGKYIRPIVAIDEKINAIFERVISRG